MRIGAPSQPDHLRLVLAPKLEAVGQDSPVLRFLGLRHRPADFQVRRLEEWLAGPEWASGKIAPQNCPFPLDMKNFQSISFASESKSTEFSFPQFDVEGIFVRENAWQDDPSTITQPKAHDERSLLWGGATPLPRSTRYCCPGAA